MTAPTTRRIRDAIRNAADATDDPDTTAELHEQADAIADLAEPDDSLDHNRDRLRRRHEDLRQLHEQTTGDARDHLATALEALRGLRDD